MSTDRRLDPQRPLQVVQQLLGKLNREPEFDDVFLDELVTAESRERWLWALLRELTVEGIALDLSKYGLTTDARYLDSTDDGQLIESAGVSPQWSAVLLVELLAGEESMDLVFPEEGTAASYRILLRFVDELGDWRVDRIQDSGVRVPRRVPNPRAMQMPGLN